MQTLGNRIKPLLYIMSYNGRGKQSVPKFNINKKMKYKCPVGKILWSFHAISGDETLNKTGV